MFGHQDNQPTEQSDQGMIRDSALDDMTGSGTDQAQLHRQSTIPGSSPSPASTSTSPTWQHPGRSLADSTADRKNDVISPAGGYPQALSSKEPVLDPIPTPAININTHGHPSLTADDNQLTEVTNDDLIHVKQEALDELFPLIDKLNQTPDEHFKTLMMIIQASDNHTLIEKAFQIAQTIDDEKTRAQALLDIINEINYFTQQPKI